ncbi:MAG: META domain-containing protein [Patescibacteria group bacterium]
MNKDNTLIIILILIFIILAGISATKLFPGTVLQIVDRNDVQSPVTVNGTTSAPTTLDVSLMPISISSSTPTVNVNGSTFRLTTFNNTVIGPDQKYTLGFEGSKLNAKFCNNMGGEYTLQNGILRSNMISTMMACAEPANLMLIESTFGSMVSSGAKFSLQGHTLTLIDTLNNTMVFTVFMD